MGDEKIQAATDVAAEVGNELTNQAKNFLHLDEFSRYFTVENLTKVIAAVIALLVMVIVYKIIKKLVNKHAGGKFEPHTVALLNKAIKYVFYVLIVMYVLGLLGINLRAIWGAAGVAGVAIGFAAQTAMSNLISGIFVLSEKTMKIGDFISVAGVSGTVESVGLLSAKIKTLDNQVIRIPNSSVINNNLTNFSAYPIRRFVFDVPVSYETDLAKAIEVMNKLPSRCPTVLSDPAPAVFYDGFESAVMMRVAVWFKGADLIQTKNDVYQAIVKLCDENGITIPYTRYNVAIVSDQTKK
jgi:small-conductance mechanosensitive channel